MNKAKIYPVLLTLLMLSLFFIITSTTRAAEMIFEAYMTGEDAGAVTQATGEAQFMVNDDHTAISYKIEVTDIENVTMAHIHLAPKGQDGPPVVWLYPQAPPAKLVEGKFTGVLAEGTITEKNLVGLLAGKTIHDLLEKIEEGETYVNVHTQKYPAGEIRSQIEAEKEEPSLNYMANLTGTEAGVTTQSTGDAVFMVSEDHKFVHYKLTVTNIENVTMAHIHFGHKGQNGSPVVWLYPQAPPAKLIEGKFTGVLAEGAFTEKDLIGPFAGMTIEYLMNEMQDSETYVNIHTQKNPTGEIRGQIAVGEPTPGEDYSHVFFLNLETGLNMISLPLEPIIPYTAKTFAKELLATVVIKYDEKEKRFVGFTPQTPGDGFSIEGGKGYIVNIPKGGVISFTGAAWTNEPMSQAPKANDNTVWAFVVSGTIPNLDGNYTVTTKNLRTGAMLKEPIGSKGYFTAVYADLNRKPVVESGDNIEITVLDSSGSIVSGPQIHKVTLDELRNAVLDIHLKPGDIAYQRTVLLQNYPNPFNPETWMPYKLKDAANLVIKIHDANGKLVRTLALGYKMPGSYVSRSDAAYWNGKNDDGEQVASGIYYYTFQAGSFTATKKLVITK